MKRINFIEISLVLALLLGLTAFIQLTGADIKIEQAFYSPELGFSLGNRQPWRFIYRFAEVPAYILCGWALVQLISGFFRQRTQLHRKSLIFLILLLVLGPGLIVNTIFKDHWGRPRPNEVTIFGGNQQYLSVWVKGEGAGNGSFPSGHASVGFYLIGPYFVLRRQRPRLAAAILGTGLGAGLLVGFGRMLQGAHFASDVLWSAGFVYLTGLFLYYLLGLDREVKE